MTKARPIIAIFGPTASGKTALGVETALRLGGEVVNCDSVQIYKEIEIATAKPTKEEMKGVTHHLLDYVSPHVDYTAADWAKDAVRVISEIESRGKVPIIVGGTGFYLKTLLDPIFESPKTDETLRNKLRSIKDRKGAEHLHKILTRIDPLSAANLFPRDYVRTMRAIEVYLQTGKPIAEQQPKRAKRPEFADRVKLFVLNPPRNILYEKITERAKSHFDAGLVDEVTRLREAGIRDSSNALGSHGYRRVCEYLRGERTLESAIEKTAQNVRNYAKRQVTWFRSEPNAIWLDGFGSEPRILEELLSQTAAK